jgi:hypothetical protein
MLRHFKKQDNKNEIQNNSCSRYNLLQKYLLPDFSIMSNVIKSDNIVILIINDALPDFLYKQVSDDFISLKNVFLSNYSSNSSNLKYMLSNHLYQLNAKKIRSHNFEIKKTITDILEYHFSKMFDDSILKIYNQLFLTEIKEINKQVSNFNFNYFSPVCYLEKNKIQPNKVFINSHVLGWFLMRKDEDTSIGGNLEIYNNYKRIVSVPYQKNCFILLLNNQNNQKEKNKEEGIYYTFTSRNTTIHSMRFIDLQFNF